MILIYGTPAVETPPGITSLVDVNSSVNVVPEDAPIGTAVGITAYSTHTGYTVTYSLTDDAGGLFSIGETTGIVKTAGTFDYLAASVHAITILATSSGGETTSMPATITVLPPGGTVLLDFETVLLDGEAVVLS